MTASRVHHHARCEVPRPVWPAVEVAELYERSGKRGVKARGWKKEGGGRREALNVASQRGS